MNAKSTPATRDDDMQVDMIHPDGRKERMTLRNVRCEAVQGKPPQQYRYVLEVDAPTVAEASHESLTAARQGVTRMNRILIDVSTALDEALNENDALRERLHIAEKKRPFSICPPY